MRMSFSAACKQVQPLINFPGGINMDPFIPRSRKDKVVIVMGATGTGKSRLSIDLATRFPAEIINSDKMQVYKGLDIVTNKVTEEECSGVSHHLLGFIDPDTDFTARDFEQHASLAVESIIMRDRLPIIAGGSNSFIRALVHDNIEFQSRYDCCFLWVDVSLPVLHSFVSKRVNQMVKAGLVDEVKEFFNPKCNSYVHGIRRAIGVPEMDRFLRYEHILNGETRDRVLDEAIDNIKSNTRKLACKQLQNIIRLQTQLEWDMYRVDATEAFLKSGYEADDAWERLVARPCTRIVDQFLYKEDFIPRVAKPITPSLVTTTALRRSATSPTVVPAGVR